MVNLGQFDPLNQMKNIINMFHLYLLFKLVDLDFVYFNVLTTFLRSKKWEIFYVLNNWSLKKILSCRWCFIWSILPWPYFQVFSLLWKFIVLNWFQLYSVSFSAFNQSNFCCKLIRLQKISLLGSNPFLCYFYYFTEIWNAII